MSSIQVPDLGSGSMAMRRGGRMSFCMRCSLEIDAPPNPFPSWHARTEKSRIRQIGKDVGRIAQDAEVVVALVEHVFDAREQRDVFVETIAATQIDERVTPDRFKQIGFVAAQIL